MAKKKHDGDWARAKLLCRLSAEEVQMAKEMGLNPRNLVKNNPSKSERWKVPVKFWIRDLYRKRQEKTAKKNPSKLKIYQEGVDPTASPVVDQGPDLLDHIPF